MDAFAQKTLRGMSSTFSSLADTLHLPDSMRCCGVGVIEAQVACCRRERKNYYSHTTILRRTQRKFSPHSGLKIPYEELCSSLVHICGAKDLVRYKILERLGCIIGELASSPISVNLNNRSRLVTMTTTSPQVTILFSPSRREAERTIGNDPRGQKNE